MTSNEEIVRTSVKLPKALHAKLKWTAVTQGKSLESIVQGALERELNGNVDVSGRLLTRDIGVFTSVLETLEPAVELIRELLAKQPQKPEEVLQESATAMLEALPFAVAIKDWEDCSVVWCNVAYANLLSRPRSSIAGRTLQSILGLEEDDPTVLHTRVVTREAFEHIRVNGVDHDVMALRFYFAHLLEGNKRFIGDLSFLSSHRDAARNSAFAILPASDCVSAGQYPDSDSAGVSSLLARFLEELPTVALLKDLQGRICWANRAFLRMIGRTSLDNIVGLTSSEIFGPYIDPAIREYESLVVFGKSNVLGREVLKGDERIGVRFPIFNDNGELMYIGVVSTNKAGGAPWLNVQSSDLVTK